MAIIGGILSPWLLYLVARRLIGQAWPPLVLGLAPIQLVLSRHALDYVLPIPFVLAWLWCLLGRRPGTARPSSPKRASCAPT